ncbi:DUF4253 domain-containing protein [Flavobacterium sp. LC2016-01]|uniref:DUF4253 domain-containing protein n=1 Tax=Flavobacterium sp. LC2016-01 TaxID=2675876 RepID=UPI0012BA8D39|nr:DUF4253 domain-containing protein [Flavobacterium sp. LC2016-01]MTH15982.1 DUF4253 domain-containing protein [Flavobacterium sp. LC2016-01]
MKQKLLLAAIGISLLFGCSQKNNLTSSETELVKKINFNADLISELKELTKSDFKQLPAIDGETGEMYTDKFYDGIYTEATEDQAVEYVKKLKNKFRESGYLIFEFESNDDKKGVAVIKGTNDLDILRYRRTDGINYDVDNTALVEKISEWKTKYGLIVIGCSRDWVHIEFDKLPSDLDAFSKEVYAFCPDSVDQGVGSLSNLKAAIKEMNGLWLWWD